MCVLFQSPVWGANTTDGFSRLIISNISPTQFSQWSGSLVLVSGFMSSKPSLPHIINLHPRKLHADSSSRLRPSLRSLFDPNVTATFTTSKPHSFFKRIAKVPIIDSSSGCGANIKARFEAGARKFIPPLFSAGLKELPGSSAPCFIFAAHCIRLSNSLTKSR